MNNASFTQSTFDQSQEQILKPWPFKSIKMSLEDFDKFKKEIYRKRAYKKFEKEYCPNDIQIAEALCQKAISNKRCYAK